MLAVLCSCCFVSVLGYLFIPERLQLWIKNPIAQECISACQKNQDPVMMLCVKKIPILNTAPNSVKFFACSANAAWDRKAGGAGGFILIYLCHIA